MKIKVNTLYRPKLIFKKRIFQCQIGRNGVISNYLKIEGDKSTPRGKWKIEKILIRKKKNKKLILKKYLHSKLLEITKNLIWCDDINCRFYNKPVKVIDKNRVNYSFENMFRDDNVYDIVIMINYNQRPIIKNKGSAIFVHCSFDDMRATNGCVALKKNSLKFLINNLQKTNYVYIS